MEIDFENERKKPTFDSVLDLVCLGSGFLLAVLRSAEVTDLLSVEVTVLLSTEVSDLLSADEALSLDVARDRRTLPDKSFRASI